MRRKINQYIKKWESRGYPSGIPDEAPSRLEDLGKVPSYRLICIALMKNDRQLETLGYSRVPCSTYMEIKRQELLANAVAPPEMALLELSIWEDGYTMPVVCYYLPLEDIYEIVDGYHRYQVLKTSDRIREREGGFLPVVVIDKDESNRMASTIRHNRARGSHSIELMSNIVAELSNAGMSDAWILRHIGMDKDELLRLKQITGLAALFADKEFSRAWPEQVPMDALESEFSSHGASLESE